MHIFMHLSSVSLYRTWYTVCVIYTSGKYLHWNVTAILKCHTWNGDLVMKWIMSTNLSDTGKTALIIYAHPDVKSVNGSLLDVTRKTLKSKGYNVVISDLYSEYVEPSLARSCRIGKYSTRYFVYSIMYHSSSV